MRARFTPSMARCPACGGELLFQRIDEAEVVEYRARCRVCGWAGWLRELRCGGCNRTWLFLWTGESWRCLRCGRVRGDQSPPLDLDSYKPGGE